MKLWSPWEPAHFDDPYEMYARLRTEDPVHRSQTGEWIITRYENVREVLKDNRFITGNRLEWIKRGITHLHNHELDYHAIAQAMCGFMLFLNPPQHTRIRKFMHAVWTEREIEPQVRMNTREILSQLPKQFDVVKDFAQVLPALTMSRILGISPGDHHYLKNLALQLIKGLDLYITLKDLVTIHTASVKFIDYFRATIRENKMAESGLLKKIIQSSENTPDLLSENELISLCIFLFTAGEETTSSLIGTGTRNLLQHSGNRPITNWDVAIDELLRYESPVQLLGRIAHEDVEIAGQLIPKESTVTLCLGAANRDPEIFESPNQLNLLRDHNRHMAFGSGIHFCMGDWLARLQGKIALEELFKTYPNLRPEGQWKWTRHLSIRSLSTFPVRTD